MDERRNVCLLLEFTNEKKNGHDFVSRILFYLELLKGVIQGSCTL